MRKIVEIGHLSSLLDYIKTAFGIVDRNKEYKVNDIVKLRTKMLKCMVAGTTASTKLDLSKAQNNIISDGTVVWKIITPVSKDEVTQIQGGGTESSSPVGSIVPFAGNPAEAPANCVLCNGQEISRTIYSELFSIIGTTYGIGDGVTTFNVPDFTDKFIQGSDTAGTEKTAGLPNIEGQFGVALGGSGQDTINHVEGSFVYGEYSPSGDINCISRGSNGRSQITSFDASKSNAIYGSSDTVQPPALTMRLYIVVASGVADTPQVTAKKLLDYVNTFSGVPLGTVLPYASNNSVPAGFFECNGQEISRTVYADLFSVIGTYYGAGDGETTFNLPDYRDKFIEGSGTAGQEHEAGLPNIEGSTPSAVYEGGNNFSGCFERNNYVTEFGAAGYNVYGINFDASKSNPIYGASDTVQPPSVTARYIIRAYSAPNESEQGISLADVTELINKQSGVPAGTILTISGDTIPDGYLLCDGTTVDKAMYPSLYVAIGDKYGADTTTFNLPNDDNEDYVVESETNSDGSWYRLYKSGWLEQGGLVSGTPSNGYLSTTINLLKPMEDNKYNIGLIGHYGGGSGGYVDYAMNITTTSFKVVNLLYDGSGKPRWRVEGQSAETPSTVTHKVIRAFKGTLENANGLDVSLIANKINHMSGVPTGTILPFIGTVAPAGFLICDGSSVLKSVYPDLYAVIGDKYGNEDNEHFSLPNLTGRFLEGGTVAGEFNEAGLPNIEGQFAPAYDVCSTQNTVLENGKARMVDGAFVTKKTITSNGYHTGYGNGGTGLDIGFDASKSNLIYGNSDTVQPKSMTVRYIIRAYAGDYYSEKGMNVSALSEDLRGKYSLEKDFTIIYPNGGTKENPANITISSTYIEQNPFKGYYVSLKIELLVNNEWKTPSLLEFYTGSAYHGIGVWQLDNGTIKIATGQSLSALATSDIANTNTAPCRVKVWKIGKI